MARQEASRPDGKLRPRPATVGRMIGPHLPLGGGLIKAADRAASIGATSIQIFTDNPTAWRRRAVVPAEVPEFRARLASAGIGPLAIHAPYLINLCGARDDFWRRSIATLTNELRVGTAYGAAFVVVHIGSHRGTSREAGIARLIAGLRIVFSRLDADPVKHEATPRLVLENAAGTGDGLGASVEDLADIFDAAVTAGLPMDRLGVCLDTAHLWAAGYEIETEAGLGRLMRSIDERLGRDRVVMVHLNDSRTVRGSRMDRHEHIAAGGVGHDGMRVLLNDPWLATLPTYLETPGMDAGYDQVNLDRVRLLIAGETPPDLPESAFELHGGRTRNAPPASPAGPAKGSG